MMGAEKQAAVWKYVLATLVVAVVAGLVAVGVAPLGAPRPQPAGAAATTFSAARAFGQLRWIAATPHPIGSQAESEVRATIIARLQALGLAPHVQTAGVVSQEDGRVAGTVHNILARLPGGDPTRTVLLVAHYDSVAVAPGAADDGGGVATLLETARALAAGPQPRNDIVFLFTDGEEKGLLGSRAFIRDDPWAYGVGVVLNFDSPGSSSPALMYETTSGNGLLVRTLLGAGPHAFASSLMYEVSRRQPVETDFRRFKAAGVPGMSFGALDGPANDHTGYDSLRNFHLGSLQHEGDSALALARSFGAMDLWSLHAPDRVYFDVVGGYAVSYGTWLVWPLTGAAAVLFAAALFVAWRRRRVTLRGIVIGVPASSLVLGAALGVVGIVWGMYRPAYEQRVWTNTGVVVSDFHRLGLVLLAAAVVVAGYGLLLRRLRAWDLAAAALVWWLGAAVVLTVAIPSAAYLLTWPLAAASLGFLASALLGDRVFASAWVLVPLAGAAPGVVLLSSADYLLLITAGLKTMATVLVVWFVAGLLVLPLAVARRGFRRWLPVGLAVAGAVVLILVASSAVFDADHPKFTSVYYRQDDRGVGHWETIDLVNVWTRQFLPDVARYHYGLDYFPGLGTRTTISAPARGDHLPPPEIKVLSDSATGDRRTVTVRVRPRRPTAILSLLEDSVVGSLTASVDGRPLQSRDTTILDATPVRWYFDYYSPPAAGVVVTLRCQAGRPLALRAVDYSYGLPATAARGHTPRPPGMLPGWIGDGTFTESSLRLPASAAAAAAAR